MVKKQEGEELLDVQNNAILDVSLAASLSNRNCVVLLHCIIRHPL